MVVTDEGEGRNREKITAGDDLFGATSASSSTSDSGDNGDGQETVINIDTAELLDTAIKSIAGGLATGLVVNNVLGDK